MASDPQEINSRDDRRVRGIVGIALAGLAVLFVAGLVAVIAFADQARQRDLDQWRLRLQIVAESRAEAVADWLNAKTRTINDISDNASVRLYLTEIDSGEAGPAADAQARYLQNLLSATGSQAGFETGGGSSTVPANLPRSGVAGIMIVDRDGNLIAQSGSVERPDGLARAFRRQAGIIDDLVGGPRGLTLTVSAPIFGIQADPEQDPPLGWVVGFAPAGQALRNRLAQPGQTAETARSYLVSPAGGVSETGTASETPGMRHLGLPSEGRDRAVREIDSAAALAALDAPGRMVSARDYRGRAVLALAVPVSAPVDWSVLHTVDREEAVGAIDARRTRLIVFLSLGLIVLTALVLLAWRHGASVRLARSSRALSDLAERHEHLSRFLKTVTDHQPTEILALDRQLRCRFANRRACENLGLHSDDMRGKTLDALYGPAVAAPMIAAARRGLDGEMVSTTHETGEGAEAGIFQLYQIPLRPAADGAVVLMVREDITDLVAAQRARQAALDGTVETLVTLIDARDPYAAAHSKRVATVAADIAESMGLDESDRYTVHHAALLLNIGKLLVPRSLLTRASELTEDELAEVHTALGRAAELIAHVDFSGPVVQTLHQAWQHEDADGTGQSDQSNQTDQPDQDHGEQLLTARILIVANAFVGMISPRSYRPAIPMDKAVASLMDGAGERYDRGVVAALVHQMDNRGGRQKWARFADMPDMPFDPDIT